MATQSFTSANITATNILYAPNQLNDSSNAVGDATMIMCNIGSGSGGPNNRWLTAENNMYISKSGGVLHGTDTNGLKAMVVNSNLLYYDLYGYSAVVGNQQIGGINTGTTTYTTGTSAVAATTGNITGTGTTYTPQMVGGILTFNFQSTVFQTQITGYVSATSLTSTYRGSTAWAARAVTITYGGCSVDNTGSAHFNRIYDQAGLIGTNTQVLTSNGTNSLWTSLPTYVYPMSLSFSSGTAISTAKFIGFGVNSGTENICQQICPRAGTIVGLTCATSASTGTGTSQTVIVRKNGVTALTVTLGASVTSGSTTGSVAVAQNDFISVLYTLSSGTQATFLLYASVILN